MSVTYPKDIFPPLTFSTKFYEKPGKGAKKKYK